MLSHKHNSHDLTPAETSKPENSVDVRINSEQRAKRTNIFPKLYVNDNATIYKKNIN